MDSQTKVTHNGSSSLSHMGYIYFSAKSKAARHSKGLCVRLLASALIVWMEFFEILILIMFREWEKIIQVVQLLIWTRYGSSKAFKVVKSCFALC